MTHCPSCGRYTGPVEGCPYCGARRGGRTSLRILKLAALAFALLGLGGLWFAASRAQVPLVTLGQAGATMNMAAVRLNGRCVRGPSYDPESGTLSFWLDDGTGQARVAAYGDQAQQLVAEGRVPALGDQVEVAGTLRVRPDLLSLTLNAPEGLGVARSLAVERTIGSLTAEDEYRRVRVRGQVRSLAEPYPGLTLVTLRDGTGSVQVVLSRDLFALSGFTPTLTVGQAFEIAAVVSLYRDSVQLVPASAADLVELDRPVTLAAERATGELTVGDAGRMALVRGHVTAVEHFSAGVKATLDDGSGALTLLLWDSVYSGLPDPQALQPGAQVLAQGELALYNGALELVPELPGDVLVLATVAPAPTPAPTRALTPVPTQSPSPSPTPSPAPSVEPTSPATPLPTPTPEATSTPRAALTSIGAIAAGGAGEEVTVEGVVVSTASFSQGFKFVVGDGTGQIVLLMWHEVYDDCWDAPQLNLGARVRASGEVADYQGELQLQPGFGGDVKVLAAAGPQATARQIGSLSGSDVGQRVMIEGRVLRVSGTSSGVGVSLGDDSGEVVVFLWRNVLDRVPNNVGLGTVGSRVRVVGTVAIYRNNLQVQPALPYDVTVLEIP